MTEREMWSEFWKDLSTPSDFRADPAGEFGNQSAHAILGLIFTVILCLATYTWHGEFPQKEVAAFVVTLPYILFELLRQGWKGWDTVSDVFFFAIGGYGVLSSLSEVGGDTKVVLEPNPAGFGLSLLAFSVVMFVRVRVRVKQKYG